MPSSRSMFRAIAAGAAVATTTGLTVTAATSQTRPPVPSRLVGLANPREANKVLSAYGRSALWAFDSATDKFQRITTFSVKPGETQFTTGVHAHALGIQVRKPDRPPVAPVGDGTTVTTAPTPQASVPSSSTAAVPAASAPSVPSEPGAPAGFASSQLLLNDQFSGTSLNTSNWNPYITSAAANGAPWNSNGSGGSGTENPSLDYDSEYFLPSQLMVSNGLTIEADETPVLGMLESTPVTYPWTSGAVSSYGKFEFSGGYLQIVAKMPAGDGMWPGLWMLPGAGNSDGDNYEIDLFEGGYTGNGVNPNDNFAWHLHTPGGTVGGLTNVGVDLTGGYHVYGLEWVPGQSITWYLDGTQVGQVTSSEASIPTEPMELIMDLQVANASTAGWHTVVDSSTPTTTQMMIRSVQVYS